MSNAQKPKSGAFSLEKYKAKAKKAADETGPFVLQVDTDRSISIPRPNANALLGVEEATSSRQIISLICGEHAEEIFELFGDEDFTAINEFGSDLQRHFGIGL